MTETTEDHAGVTWEGPGEPIMPLEGPMSVIVLISSALPPGADTLGGGADGPKVIGMEVGL